MTSACYVFRTSAATHLGSASVGACMSALVRVPTDTLKHRVQAYLHHDIFDAVRALLTSRTHPGEHLVQPPFAAWQSHMSCMRSPHRGIAVQTRSSASRLFLTLPSFLGLSLVRPDEQARTITAESGVLGLYRGFWPTLLRDVPEIAIQFTLYERCGQRG